MATKACEWCGQPTPAKGGPLCAECYYKTWQKTSQRISKEMTAWAN